MKKLIEIPIEGKMVAVKLKPLDVKDVLFDVDNPRISMQKDAELEGTGAEKVGQNWLIFALGTQPSYFDLRVDIKKSGGAMQPIWVYEEKKGKYVVIEGNTRLLIHRELADKGEEKFSKINAYVFPYKCDESVKDFIRLRCHLKGPTMWDKYEQAKYLYLLWERDKMPLKDLSEKTKLSPTEIKEDIEAYEIMKDQFYDKYGKNDSKFVHKFSYFKEMVKNKKLRYAMEKSDLNTRDFCDWVGTGKLNRAMDVRKLESILRNDESRKAFLKKDIDRALDVLRDVLPEKAQRVYFLISELSRKLDKLEFEEIQKIRKKSKQRDVAMELYKKIKEILGD